jgi:hypothetical protein
VGLDPGAARERVRVRARALGMLHSAGASPRARRALVREGPCPHSGREPRRPRTVCCAVGRAGTAEHVERIVRGAASRRKAEIRRGFDSAHPAFATCVSRRGRHGDHSGRLEPEVGAALMQALSAAREALYRATLERTARTFPAEQPTMEQQQADALAVTRRVCSAPRHRPGCTGRVGIRSSSISGAAVLEDPNAAASQPSTSVPRVSAETRPAARLRRDSRGHAA